MTLAVERTTVEVVRLMVKVVRIPSKKEIKLNALSINPSKRRTGTQNI